MTMGASFRASRPGAYLAVQIALASVGLAAPPSAPAVTEAERAAAALGVAACEIHVLQSPANLQPAATFDVNLEGETYTLDLVAQSLRAPDFQLLVEDEQGMRLAQPAPPATYRGVVVGVDGSRVAASLDEQGNLSALIDMGPQHRFVVQPLADVMVAARPGEHVVFRADSAQPGPWECGVTEAMLAAAPTGQSGPSLRGGEPAGFLICDVAFDSDSEFFQANGSDVDATMRDIERVMNAVEVIYERDTGVTYEVTTIVVRTGEPDGYGTTIPSGFLGRFERRWNNDPAVSGVRRDIAHLMTGKNLDGSVIGIAYVGVVCARSSAYAVSQSRFSLNLNARASLTAHEIGHNFNARHCNGDGDCHIMCSGLGGCNGLGLPNFGAAGVNAIGNFASLVSCLDAESFAPLSPPFFDDFEAGFGSIDTVKWSYREAQEIVEEAWNEPSGVYSLNLDSQSPRQFGEDNDLRSNEIRLGGQSGFAASYWTQHRGVEDGETLTVFYWNNDFEWRVLNTIVSDGVDQDQFEFWEHNLPPDAYHDGFRLRFRVDGDEPNDDWYIDDVRVSDVPLPTPNIDHVLVETPIRQRAINADPTLADARSYELRVMVANGDDWVSTAATANLANGRFYQNATDPAQDAVPEPNQFAPSPALEFDSYWAAPGPAVPQFNGTPQADCGALTAEWSDSADTGEGEFTIARFTVRSGQVLQVAGETASRDLGSTVPFERTVAVDLASACDGDVDGDQDADLDDLTLLLSAFDTTIGDTAFVLPADQDCDGDVDLDDLTLMLSTFGQSCP